MQTILVKKEALDPEDTEKHRYLELLAKQHREVTRALALKNSDKTYESLQIMEDTAALAFDVKILKEVKALQCACATYFAEWTKGIIKHKSYVRIAPLILIVRLGL